MMDVLLISPRVPSTNPHYCGDYAYTDILLKYPPPGIRYFHYTDLLMKGIIKRLHFWQAASYYLTEWGVLPPDMWFEALDSSFVPDIVHIYGFSALVHLSTDHHPPVVLGAGTGSFSDLKYYHAWQKARIRCARQVKRAYLRLMNAYDSSLRPEKAAHVLVWSEFSRQMHVSEGYVAPEQISVLPPGLPYNYTKTRTDITEPTVFLFIGRDFKRKNGPLVLEAFRRVHVKQPDTCLLLVSQLDDEYSITQPGVIHRSFVPRDKLLQDIYPQSDVLLLPSKAEGFGLVILEAMSSGLPTIAIDAWAMPEIIKDGVNGFLIQPDSLQDLVATMCRLAVDSTLLRAMQANSLAVFEARFSIEAHNQGLKKMYNRVLNSK